MGIVGKVTIIMKTIEQATVTGRHGGEMITTKDGPPDHIVTLKGEDFYKSVSVGDTVALTIEADQWRTSQA